MWKSVLAALSDIGKQWEKLTTAKKAAFSVVIIAVIASMIGLGSWVGEKSYAPLYKNLQPENAVDLVKTLQDMNIPYMVSEDGGTVSIPPELVQTTMMKMAIKGVRGGTAPGMEIFDKESFGTSSYVQRINYVRALQGELSRTINTLKPVRKSNVHISLPPKAGLFEENEDPKASVVVDVYPGEELSQSEIRGIQELVGASVERLRPERVAVLSTTGVALSRSSDGISALSSTMLEHQRKIEKDMEARIEEVLSRMMGMGKVVARVNAELDFDPMKENETIIDPENSAVLNQDKSENSMEGTRPVAQGAAGAQSAVPGPASVTPEAKQQVARSSDRTNYEVSKKFRQREKALGAVKRVTVAVLVDHETKKAADGKETTVPLTEEKKQTIEKLVKDIVGFTPDRDRVTIESSEFAKEDLDKADQIFANRQRRQLIFSLIRYGTVALFILLFFVIVVRPFIRWVTGMSTTKVETALPKTVEELEIMQEADTSALPGLANLPLLEETVDLEKAEGELLKEKVVSLIDASPAKAAQIISEWLGTANPDEKKAKGKRK